MEWEVEENIKARVDFVLMGANANQGVQPKDASARRICIPVGLAVSALTVQTTNTQVQVVDSRRLMKSSSSLRWRVTLRDGKEMNT